MNRFIAQANRLYEQEQRDKTPLLGEYVRRFVGWSKGGLNGEVERPHLVVQMGLCERAVMLFAATGPNQS